MHAITFYIRMRRKIARETLFVHSQHPVLCHLTLFVLLLQEKYTTRR